MTTQSQATESSQPAPAKRGGAGRIIKWIVIVVLLVLVVGGLVVYLKLDEIVRSTVEKQSSASLNVPTQLQGASVSLFGGEVGLKDFKVGSPQGFVGDMLRLGGLDVGVKVSELRQDPLRISQITIKDPKLVIEMKGTDFNIKKFVDQLPTGEPKPADQSQPLKLIINDLKVQGAQVIFKPDLAALSSLPGIGQNLGGLKSEYTLSIPPLEMQNVGTGEGNQNGAQIKEVVTMLITQLAAKATESEQLPPELRQILKLNVNDLTNMAKAKIGEEVNKQLGKISEDLQKKLPGDAGKALDGVLKNPSEAAKDPGKALEQGLGGLIGGKKKSPTTAPAPATPPK